MLRNGVPTYCRNVVIGRPTASGPRSGAARSSRAMLHRRSDRRHRSGEACYAVTRSRPRRRIDRVRGASRRSTAAGARRCTRSAGVDLVSREGEFVAIMGPSGSGKSTAMNIIGCLDTPTSGDYLFQGVEVGRLDRNQRALIRRHLLGFVFQGFNLLRTHDGGRECRAAADLSRHVAGGAPSSGAAGRSSASALPAASSTPPPSFPAASSSASRSRAPSSPIPACCSPTSRPAISTPRPAARSWTS